MYFPERIVAWVDDEGNAAGMRAEYCFPNTKPGRTITHQEFVDCLASFLADPISSQVIHGLEGVTLDEAMRKDLSRKLISYCQERYLLLDLLQQIHGKKPELFSQYFGEDVAFLPRHGELSMVEPEHGAVLLDTVAFENALDVLKGKLRKYKNQERIEAIACLMQLLEALIIHEQIYVLDNPFPLERTGLEKVRELFRTLPMSYEVENDLHRLPKTTDAPTLVYPTNPTYSLLAAAKAGLPYRSYPGEKLELPLSVYRKSGKSYFFSFANHIIKRVNKSAASEKEQMNRLLSESRFSIQTPIIFNYIMDENQKRREPVIDTALRLRESTEAKSFRKFCSEFDFAAREGDHDSLYLIKSELEKACSNLNLKCQQPTLQFDLAFPLSISINPIELWKFVQHKRKRHLIFIDRLYQAALKSKGNYHLVALLLRRLK